MCFAKSQKVDSFGALDKKLKKEFANK